MQFNSTLSQPETKPLSRAEIKREMKRRKGFTFASYARMMRKSKSAITRVADGEIGGDFRSKFLRFFAFSEIDVPYRGPKPFLPKRKSSKSLEA